jgi:hypothetical protein
MPKYKHGSGSVYRPRKKAKNGKRRIMKVYWLSYYKGGKRIRESSGTRDEAKAWQELRKRQGQIAEGKFTGLGADRVTIQALTDDLLAEFRANGKRSLATAQIRVDKHLLPFFGDKTAHEVTTSHIREYSTARQAEGTSNATINRELALLKRAFNLSSSSREDYPQATHPFATRGEYPARVL